MLKHACAGALLGLCAIFGAVGVFAAQGLKFVGGEINYQQAAIGMQNTAGLEQGAARVVKIVQDLVNDHEISRGIGEGEGVDFPLPDLGMAQGLFFQV